MQRLQTNIDANPKLGSRIACVHAALAETTGDTFFYETTEPTNCGIGSLSAGSVTDVASCRIRAWSGDDMIARGIARAPDVIKLDIEGFEYPALRGMSDHLRRNTPLIVFEHEPYRLNAANSPPSPVPFLREFGYEIAAVRASGALEPLSSRDAGAIG